MLALVTNRDATDVIASPARGSELSYILKLTMNFWTIEKNSLIMLLKLGFDLSIGENLVFLKFQEVGQEAFEVFVKLGDKHVGLIGYFVTDLLLDVINSG